MSSSQQQVSSLNMTRLTGLGGTGSPHVHTHSQLAGRDVGPDSVEELLCPFRLEFGLSLEDLWKDLTAFWTDFGFE